MTIQYDVRVLDDFTKDGFVRDWIQIAEGTHEWLPWFQSPQWVLSWWETFGAESAPLILGVYVDNELIAVAPWFVRERVVRFMGDPLNDVNAVLVREPHDSVAVLLALLHHLPGVLSSRKLSARTLLLDCWLRPLPDLDRALYVASERPLLAVPILKLPRNFDQYLRSLPTSRRRNILYATRALERAIPQYRFEVPADIQRKIKLAETLLLTREESLGPRGFLEQCEPSSRSARFRDFLIRLIEDPTAPSRVQLGALIAGDETIAVGLYFRWRSTLMKYMQGWSMEHRKLSAGSVLDFRMIEHGLAAGVRIIDFGRGDEPYKARFGAENQWLRNYTIEYSGSAVPTPAASPTGFL